MSNNLKIDTETIKSVAATIKSQNEQLYNTLKQSEATVQSLPTIWSGAAAENTVQAYQAFAKKYFDQYHSKMEEYVKFLNNIAAEGYAQTEQQNKQLADQI